MKDDPAKKAAAAAHEPSRTTVEPMLLTVEEAIAALRISRSHFYEEVGRGRLRVAKTGRRTLISVRALHDWIEDRERDPELVREPARRAARASAASERHVSKRKGTAPSGAA